MRAPSKSKLSIYWTWNQDFSIKHKLNLYFDTPLIIQYLLNQKTQLIDEPVGDLESGGQNTQEGFTRTEFDNSSCTVSYINNHNGERILRETHINKRS